jgi:predicted metal-dependent hydrolase
VSATVLQPAKCAIQYGSSHFDVKVSYRKRDRLTIHVHPDQTVTAVAPAGQPWDRVHARLKARASWIARQLRYFEQFKPSPVPRRYVSGETVLYLGRQYRLRVRRSGTPSVRLRGQHLLVELPDAATEKVKALVQEWYRGRAGEVLRVRLSKCLEHTASLGLHAPEVRLRRMRTRWGSCTAAGTVILHPDLVMVPSHCVDYVIVHELCHRKVLRHDCRFYRLLERYLPDWKRRKKRLDQFVLAYTSRPPLPSPGIRDAFG